MRISIAMCTYNGARFLQRQLESIARQRHAPQELIVCDDGSTDATLSLLESFAHTVTYPVRIFKNERNLGSTKNFEKAIGICEGDLIALCDQDDEWYPDKLARMHCLFEEFPGALAAFSDGDIVDDDSVDTGRKLWKSFYFSPRKKVAYVDGGIVSTMLKLEYIATGATMVFRAELREHFMPIPALWPHDAWIAWIAALRGGLAPLPVSTIRYRVHSTQQIGVTPAKFVERLEVAKKNRVFFALVAERLKDVQRFLEEHRENRELEKLIPILSGKIQHLKKKASLPGSFFERAHWILASWREYHRYTRGLLAMVYDALFMPGEEPGR